MLDSSTNNKRIAKNTVVLYVRMLILMLVSLYTSRVILNALGVVDYGIYNVVGGVVTMFSVLSGSLSAAISRFLTFELGVGNTEKLKRIFSSSVTIQVGLAFIILILAETIGLWFLNNKMVIPENRIAAANWCFQFSIITFSINLISVPYNAAIIAHEKMSAFAYISIVEGVGKLIIAWCIVINPIDRLIFFAAMVGVLAWTICFIYASYCKRYFPECSYRFIYDHDLLKQMFGFAGWNFIGASASIFRDQGGNIVINMFCGPSVNAARGIATKVSSVITGFVQNFMVALNPQIIKSYVNDREYMMTLIYKGARFSFYLLLLLSLPVLLNTHYLLVIWLKLVPDHTTNFIKLVLIFALHESLANPLITAMLATGDIKKYQIYAGGLNLMNLPSSYIALRMGYAPESVLLIAIFFSFAVQAVRLYLLREMISLNVKTYLKKVYLNIIAVFVISISIPMMLSRYLDESMLHFSLSVLVSLVWTSIVITGVGLNKKERSYALNKAIDIFQKSILKK